MSQPVKKPSSYGGLSKDLFNNLSDKKKERETKPQIFDKPKDKNESLTFQQVMNASIHIKEEEMSRVEVRERVVPQMP